MVLIEKSEIKHKRRRSEQCGTRKKVTYSKWASYV
jgi:hypothetical protein